MKVIKGITRIEHVSKTDPRRVCVDAEPMKDLKERKLEESFARMEYERKHGYKIRDGFKRDRLPEPSVTIMSFSPPNGLAGKSHSE